jgi:hypothetical protein
MLKSVSQFMRYDAGVTLQYALDSLDTEPSRALDGTLDPYGEFIANCVPYSAMLHELKLQYLPNRLAETSPFYQLIDVRVRDVLTDQKLIVREKTKSIVTNYTSINKPILIAKFEECPFFLVVNGNHRLSGARLLEQTHIAAYLVDVRESFV